MASIRLAGFLSGSGNQGLSILADRYPHTTSLFKCVRFVTHGHSPIAWITGFS
jgi:hypothetical protein